MVEENGKDEDLLVVFDTNSDTRDWIADMTSEMFHRLGKRVAYGIIRGAVDEMFIAGSTSALRKCNDETIKVILDVLRENADITTSEDGDGRHVRIIVHGKGIRIKEMERRLEE
jgi:hypothetical protein